MAHRIIISSIDDGGESLTHEIGNDSRAIYSFTYEPSHHLSEREQDRRISKIRKTMADLEKEVCAPERVG